MSLNIDALYPLPEFDWQGSHARPVHQHYLDYYGINFGKSMADRVTHRFGIKPLAGYRIMVHYFAQQGEAKGSVILNHGYMDHVGLYNHLLKVLLEAGYSVLAYDLPGHGLSSGEQAGIADFAEYQKVLKALLDDARLQLPKPWAMLGQSTGGSIAMDYLLHTPVHDVSKLVLLAPLVRPKLWFWIRLQLLLAGRVLTKVPRRFAHNSSDDAFLHFLKYEEPLQTRWIKVSWVRALANWQAHFLGSAAVAVPALVVQGESDVTVEWQYNLPQIRRKFTRLTEKHLLPANHHLVKEAPELREQVFAAVLAFLS